MIFFCVEVGLGGNLAPEYALDAYRRNVIAFNEL